MGDMAIAGRIRAEREAAGLTIAQCARAVSWEVSVWRRMEDGSRPVYADHLPAIARLLGVTVARLFGEQPHMVPHLKRRGRKPHARHAASSPESESWHGDHEYASES